MFSKTGESSAAGRPTHIDLAYLLNSWLLAQNKAAINSTAECQGSSAFALTAIPQDLGKIAFDLDGIGVATERRRDNANRAIRALPAADAARSSLD